MKTYRFDQYVQDAAIEPFVLAISDNPDENIVIQPPNGETLLALEETLTSRGRLKLFLGEQYDQVWVHIGLAPGGVLAAIVKDMAGHFGMDFQRTPPGGTGASSS